MAGDIGIHEQAIVLPAGAFDSYAQAAVQQASGGVMHQYGSRVVIAAVPPGADAPLHAQLPALAIATEAGRIPDVARSGLDEVEAMGLEAFQLRQSAEYAAAKARRPLNGETWGSGAALPPDPPAEVAGDGAGAPALGLAAPTSARLMGRVAVGLIIVEGPTNNLRFSSAERTKVVAEVQNGLSWLGSRSSPAGVTWIYDIRIVTLTVQPGPANESFDQKEARWRDPAMAQLGQPAGMGGVQSYIENLRSSLGTNWAYCAFFTKYPLGHFAYASIGGPRLVMHYDNDGWGPDNIDRVFAHETGHIFNAPDEYASSGCNCGGQWGAFGVANQNCENCAPSGGVACLMKSNSWEMCVYTPYHLGFPQGQRYSGVFQAGSGSYGLWVNADWQHFVAKWQEWSNQGLRLDDLEISQPGGQLRYSGVFSQGSGGHGLWALADWNSFAAKWQEWSNQGLRLVDLEITPVGNSVRYSGVFRAGSGGYGLWALADWNSFVAKWQEWSGQGLRLVDFTVTPVGGQYRYSGVFRAGTGGYGLWALADWNSFVAKWQEWSGQGLRLVDLEITGLGNNDTRYSGVFLAGSGGYGLWVNSDWANFATKWETWSAGGLRLTDVDITLTGIEVAASPTSGAASGPTGQDAAGYGFVVLAPSGTAGATIGADAGTGDGFGVVSPLPASSGDVGGGTGRPFLRIQPGQASVWGCCAASRHSMRVGRSGRTPHALHSASATLRSWAVRRLETRRIPGKAFPRAGGLRLATGHPRLCEDPFGRIQLLQYRISNGVFANGQDSW
jgi:hypothetical protein